MPYIDNVYPGYSTTDGFCLCKIQVYEPPKNNGDKPQKPDDSPDPDELKTPGTNQEPPKPLIQPTAKTTNNMGKIGWAVLWLLGVPIPVLFFLFVIRGCQ